MHTHINAPPGAISGPLSHLPADLQKTYADEFLRLYGLRQRIESALHRMVVILDDLDAATEDMEPDEDLEESDPVGSTLKLGKHCAHFDASEDAEPSLAAPEPVTCDDGPAALLPRRKQRRQSIPARNTLRVDRSCDQSDWSRDKGFRTGGDLEHDTSDDEPSLGAPERSPYSAPFGCVGYDCRDASGLQADWAAGSAADGEGDLADTADDREGRDVLDEGEETLGWPEGHVAQLDLGWNTADADTTAPERYGKGFEQPARFARGLWEDHEPSLGSGNPDLGTRGLCSADGGPATVVVGLSGLDQRFWSDRTTDDRESDEAERGIGDHDGLTEQKMRHAGIIVDAEGDHV